MRGAVDFLKKTYASADPRSLGIFRIALGVVLFFDVLRRVPEIHSHFSNSGWLTNHFMLFRPMSERLLSVYLAFSSPEEVRFLMALHLLLCVLFIIGWRTRLMHLLVALLLVSINSRNIMLENGGSVVLTALTIWTLFLPLGRRFSIDAIRASLRQRYENGADALNDRTDPPRTTAPVVSLAVTALILQWVVIYALNVVQKSGPEWKDGTAVYYLFHQDRVISGFAEWIRGFLSLGAFKALTYSGLAIEGLVPLLLVLPVWTARARMLAWALAAALHLSIALVVDLGPFSWAMIIMFIVLVPASVWDGLNQRFEGRFPRFDLYFRGASGFWIGFCRVVKRFDVLDHVRFVPVSVPKRSEAAPPEELDEEEDDDEDEAEDDEEGDDPDEGKSGDGGSAKVSADSSNELEYLVSKTLVVEAAKGGERFTGIRALFALATAVPGGTLLTLPLRLPGVRGLVDRRLARAARHPADVDAWFEVDELPKKPERRAPSPTPARKATQRVFAGTREGTVLLVMVACGLQVLVENPIFPAALKPRGQPTFMRAMVVYPRMFQGWSMFAPSPATTDGRLVIDGVTADGRRLDPLTGEPPVFEVAPPSARRMNQIWGEFHRRVGDRRFEPYMEGLEDFIRRHHDVVKRPKDRLTAFEGWYVTETIPPPGGRKKPAERRLLFSEGVMPEGRGVGQMPHRHR
jgi:hypothetical protein